MYDLYIINYKALSKEIKQYLSKWNNIHFMVCKTILVDGDTPQIDL